MLASVFCVVAICATAYGSGEVTFIHHPKSIIFKGNEVVDQSFLKEVYSAALGFSTSQDTDWTGVRVLNPFHYGEAIVTLIVDGIESLDSVKGHHFAMNTDEEEDVTWLILERRVRNRFPSQNNTLMRIELSEGIDAVAPFHGILGDIESPILPNVQYLDMNVTEDRDFISEVSLLKEIVKNIEGGSVSRDGIPDVYWFVLRGLHAVWDLHGDESPATVEAKQLLHETITEMNYAFKKAYGGRVLCSLVTTDVSHTRQTRSVGDAGSDVRDLARGLGAAEDYDDTYSEFFNIILWTSVVLIMSLIAICVTIMRMDPGRDSIIYRMTTMKSMKKEN